MQILHSIESGDFGTDDELIKALRGIARIAYAEGHFNAGAPNDKVMEVLNNGLKSLIKEVANDFVKAVKSRKRKTNF